MVVKSGRMKNTGYGILSMKGLYTYVEFVIERINMHKQNFNQYVQWLQLCSPEYVEYIYMSMSSANVEVKSSPRKRTFITTHSYAAGTVFE